MNIEQARKILIRVCREEFDDKTFSGYIKKKLAGDFAVEVAKLLVEKEGRHRPWAISAKVPLIEGAGVGQSPIPVMTKLKER
jgi:hypothetical protein